MRSDTIYEGRYLTEVRTGLNGATMVYYAYYMLQYPIDLKKGSE